MDVLNSIRINDVNFPVTNETDYYLQDWLFSDYGFELSYRVTRRGVKENRWQTTLRRNGFVYNGQFGSINKLHDWETRNNQLYIPDFIDRPFHIMWWAGNLYQLLFDGQEFLLDNVRNGPILQLTL